MEMHECNPALVDPIESEGVPPRGVKQDQPRVELQATQPEAMGSVELCDRSVEQDPAVPTESTSAAPTAKTEEIDRMLGEFKKLENFGPKVSRFFKTLLHCIKNFKSTSWNAASASIEQEELNKEAEKYLRENRDAVSLISTAIGGSIITIDHRIVVAYTEALKSLDYTEALKSFDSDSEWQSHMDNFRNLARIEIDEKWLDIHTLNDSDESKFYSNVATVLESCDAESIDGKILETITLMHDFKCKYSLENIPEKLVDLANHDQKMFKAFFELENRANPKGLESGLAMATDENFRKSSLDMEQRKKLVEFVMKFPSLSNNQKKLVELCSENWSAFEKVLSLGQKITGPLVSDAEKLTELIKLINDKPKMFEALINLEGISYALIDNARALRDISEDKLPQIVNFAKAKGLDVGNKPMDLVVSHNFGLIIKVIHKSPELFEFLEKSAVGRSNSIRGLAMAMSDGLLDMEQRKKLIEFAMKMPQFPTLGHGISEICNLYHADPPKVEVSLNILLELPSNIKLTSDNFINWLKLASERPDTLRVLCEMENIPDSLMNQAHLLADLDKEGLQRLANFTRQFPKIDLAAELVRMHWDFTDENLQNLRRFTEQFPKINLTTGLIGMCKDLTDEKLQNLKRFTEQFPNTVVTDELMRLCFTKLSDVQKACAFALEHKNIDVVELIRLHVSDPEKADKLEVFADVFKKEEATLRMLQLCIDHGGEFLKAQDFVTEHSNVKLTSQLVQLCVDDARDGTNKLERLKQFAEKYPNIEVTPAIISTVSIRPDLADTLVANGVDFSYETSSNGTDRYGFTQSYGDSGYTGFVHEEVRNCVNEWFTKDSSEAAKALLGMGKTFFFVDGINRGGIPDICLPNGVRIVGNTFDVEFVRFFKELGIERGSTTEDSRAIYLEYIIDQFKEAYGDKARDAFYVYLQNYTGSGNLFTGAPFVPMKANYSSNDFGPSVSNASRDVAMTMDEDFNATYDIVYDMSDSITKLLSQNRYSLPPWYNENTTMVVSAHGYIPAVRNLGSDPLDQRGQRSKQETNVSFIVSHGTPPPKEPESPGT
jgi:inhibitor of KinA sporulation pathway (predicted exonuclease)